MIRALQGTVTHHHRDGIVLTTGDVGYLVAVPLRALPPLGAKVSYLTHHHIREDTQALFGFETVAELEAFQRLLTVPSIGPKSALAILSVATVDELAQAVENGNAPFFAAVPGIGRKSAAKIIVELKGQLVTPSMLTDHNELADALRSLGYRDADIATLLRKLPRELTTLQEKLTWSLRTLAAH